MIRSTLSFLVLVLSFSFIACSQTPVVSISLETPTPAIAATAGPEVTLASSTPWVGGIETALAAFTPATPNPHVLPTFSFPPTMEPPTDFSPVLYGVKLHQLTTFFLLGGVGRETWLAPDISVSRFPSAGTYSLHSFTQKAKYFVEGSAPVFSPNCQQYIVGFGAPLDESTGFVGVLDGWDVMKRTVNELVDNEGFYRQSTINWLKAEGVPAPQVDSIHVYRVDIEGDGVDEVFISAVHLDKFQHTTKAGDYSVVLIHQVVGNKAVTKLVVGDIYRSQEPDSSHPHPPIYSLTNFIDLNQDGRLEVIVEIQKWEGFGARVFQIDGDDVIQTLSAEC